MLKMLRNHKNNIICVADKVGRMEDIMKTEKRYEITAYVDENTNNDFYELMTIYDLEVDELVEKIVHDTRERELALKDDGMGLNVRQGCLTHMCKIIDAANQIAQPNIRTEILEEVNVVCEALK